ncbi:sulfurtransferase [Geomonas sp. RF6]|uniref:rhodanese-like domain-containing protein n=1 Tax=Geomonas sp. RF6 TaxID=2897342 RepID=UPI001E584565|nr:rhodanese-like domain-containing protein [Geomonas sp. RF6]UFS70062.1 sulfurtransferase [Geomonas sp. RF6]
MTSLRTVLTCAVAIVMLFAASVVWAAEFRVISTEGLKEMMDSRRDFTLVDARTPVEFKEAHIVNAINIQEDDFDAALSSLPKDNDAQLVFYCNGVKCGKSKKVAQKAQAAGFRNLLLYSEGFPVWEEKGMPIVTGPGYDKKIKTVRVAPNDLATLLKEKQAEYVLVDVREPKEFTGGHIPGAVNIPLGTFAANSGSLPKDKGIIVYCNTGKRSAKAYRKLEKLGYDALLEATYVDWKDAGLPIAK